MDGVHPSLGANSGGGQNRSGVCYPNKARALCARHDSSPCADRGQNVVCVQNTGQGWWNEGEVAETLRTPCGGDSTKANLIVCGVDIPTLTTFAPEGNHCGAYREDDTSATLQTKYHYGAGGDAAVAVYDCRGNGNGETAPTVIAHPKGGVHDYDTVCVENTDGRARQSHVFENHSQDTRFTGPVDVSQTVSATFGMGGNNTPFVVEEDDE